MGIQSQACLSKEVEQPRDGGAENDRHRPSFYSRASGLVQIPFRPTKHPLLGDDSRARPGDEGPDPAVDGKPTVDKIVAARSLRKPQNAPIRYRCARRAESKRCKSISYLRMVGAGRFERPTPCAQDMLIPSFGHQ